MNEIKIIEVENEDVVITVDGAENEDVVVALDGSVACWSEIYGDPKKSKALMALLDELLKLKVDSNELIVGDTKCKITYDEKGLVISGEDLTIDDLPELLLAHIKDVIATAEEVNILHGIEITTEELNRLKGLLVTAEELNKLVGLDISIDDLNSVVNKLDKNPPITAGTYTKVKVDEKGLVVQGQNLSEADIPPISLGNVYDVTVSNNVLNKLTGLEVGATELNQLKNIEGNVQTQINKYIGIIPDEATIDNQLADKKFVRDWVYDHAGYYVTKMPNGKPFTNKQELIDTVTFYHLGEVKRLSENDFAVVEKDETQGYQMAMYIYDRDEVYNEGHWILQYIIPRDAGYITNVIMNGVLQPVTDNVVNLGTVITKHQNISGKQDVIADLDTIRKGAELGSTALQSIPDEYVTETELNNKGYLTSYTETDPVYTADKPNIATKDELTQGLSIKQDVISDLESIRTGAELGSTALQSIPDEYVTETELNNKGYLTSYTETDPVYTADKPNIALKSELPTKVSSLINDADYQTATDVASMIASIPQFEIKIVDVLPTEGQKMVLYLIPKTSASGDNIYDEYIWLESTSSFELVGSTTVDLNDYYSKTETNELLNAKQDSISDLEAIRNGASLGSTALQSVPDEYITETELNAKGYLTSYTETDPIYTADKPYLALKSELPTIPTNISELNNDAGYITNTVDNLVNYTDTTALTDLLSKKQDTLINQENIKSVNNQSLLGSGNIDIENVQNITYAELLSLKNNGELKKGLFYRITDYVTTTNGASASYKSESSRSVGHQFDIIIQALGPSDLSEICTACLHEGDTYFINDNLSGWQIWYDINNDTSKYAWADTTNGKGVIYRLIDEKGNECPYDFKNIQFYRNPSNYPDIKSQLTVSDGYYYTFSHYTSNTTVEDWTLGKAGTKLNFENKLGQCSDRQSNGDTNTIKKLNNSIFVLSKSEKYMTRNYWGINAYNNTMCGNGIYNNSAVMNFTNNICGSLFINNSMGLTVNNNKFLGEFDTNYISGSFNFNTMKGNCYDNMFYPYFYNNTADIFMSNLVCSDTQNNNFGSEFRLNIVGGYFMNNTMTAILRFNYFGPYFRYNTLKSTIKSMFGGYITHCTIGSEFNCNNVSNNAYYCTFGDYNTNNTVEPSTSYIKTASGTSTTNLGLSNSTIKAGVVGSSSTNLLDLTALPTNTSYPMTIEKDVNGKILATWSDLGVTKGKYKESVTATTWNNITPDYYTTAQIDEQIGDISSVLDSLNGEVQ